MACYRSVFSNIIRKGIGVNPLKLDRLNHTVVSVRNCSCCLRSSEKLIHCSKFEVATLPESRLFHSKTRLANARATLVRYHSRHHDHWTDLAYEDFVALVDSRDIQLFDVREPKEIEETGSFPNAVNMPLGQVKEALFMEDTLFEQRFKVSKPQKHDTNIVFVGLGPIKSSAAVELAHKFGFKKARHYPGGYEEWSQKKIQ